MAIIKAHKRAYSKNSGALHRFEQAYAANIKELYWIAGCMNNTALMRLINSLPAHDWESLFPDVANDGNLPRQKGVEALWFLYNCGKLGFIAAIEIPQCHSFIYDKHHLPIAWSARRDHNHIRYAYAETTSDLLTNIEAAAKACFEYDLKNAVNFNQ